MTPLEVMALIVVVLALIKIIVILIDPKKWMYVVEAVYTSSGWTSLIALLVGGVVLWYLLQEMTIVHIFAVMLFIICLMVLGFGTYGNDLIALANRVLRDKAVIRKAWLSILIWVLLSIWVLFELFKQSV